MRLARRRGVAWLDSSLPRAGDGRHSILCAEPRWTFRSYGPRWEISYADGHLERGDRDAIAELDRRLAQRRIPISADGPALPFYGGAIGWLSYDLGRQFERLGSGPIEDVHLPDLHLAWYDAAAVWDHAAQQLTLVSIEGERPAEAAVAELARWLNEPAPSSTLPATAPPPCIAQANFTRDTYETGVRTVRQRIAQGEFYQLNLVQRFRCSPQELPATTYLRLRAANPAPFAAYLSAEDICILSSSPERFLEVEPDGRVRTCPIKGTRRRGASPADDASLRAELLASPKERAELLMIVDLLRNDLGRVCTAGSIEVPRLHSLESFATVHHLVGEVRGQLRPEVTPGSLLRAVFPGGSITGAPKVSAMRAIDQLEPTRRGIGMGSIGYFSAHGRIDLSIAIRTIISHSGVADIPVGAGIVWDSDPSSEYEETLAKARAQFAALGVTAIIP